MKKTEREKREVILDAIRQSKHRARLKKVLELNEEEMQVLEQMLAESVTAEEDLYSPKSPQEERILDKLQKRGFIQVVSNQEEKKEKEYLN